MKRSRSGSWRARRKRRRVIGAGVGAVVAVGLAAVLVVDARSGGGEHTEAVEAFRTATATPRNELVQNANDVLGWVRDLNSEAAAATVAAAAREKTETFEQTGLELRGADAGGPLVFARSTQVAAQDLLAEAATLLAAADRIPTPEGRQALRRKAARSHSIANSLIELTSWYLHDLSEGNAYRLDDSDVLSPKEGDPFELEITDEVQSDAEYARDVENHLDSLDAVLADMQPVITGLYALGRDDETLRTWGRDWTAKLRKIHVRLASTPGPIRLQAAHGALHNSMWLYVDSVLSFTTAPQMPGLSDLFVANGKALRNLADQLRLAATDEIVRVTGVVIDDPPESGFSRDPHQL